MPLSSVEDMNGYTFFSVPENNHICVENNIVVYKGQLNVGLQKKVQAYCLTCVSAKDCDKSNCNGFLVL